MLSSTLSATLALLVSCPTLPANSLELVPDTATLVVGGDVDRIVGTGLGQALVRGLEADLQVGEALAILDECGVALEHVDEVWLARDAGEGRLLFVRADPLAEPATLACIAAELRARDQGRDPWTEQTGDCTTLDLRDGSRAWVLGTAWVWARGPMIPAIELANRKPNPLLAAIDRSKHAWLAATLDQPRWAIEARSITATIDLERQGRAGLWADFVLTADDLAGAATLRDRMVGLIIRFADHLDALGIEHRLRERARLGIVEGSLVGEVEIDLRELEQIHDQLAGAGLF